MDQRRTRDGHVHATLGTVWYARSWSNGIKFVPRLRICYALLGLDVQTLIVHART